MKQERQEFTLSDALQAYQDDPVLHAFICRLLAISRAGSTEGAAKYNYETEVIHILAEFNHTLQEENRRLKAEVTRLTALVPAYVLADLIPKIEFKK